MNAAFYLVAALGAALFYGCWTILKMDCRHQRESFPQRNIQRCLDCGAFRRYRIGQKPGPWIVERKIRKEVA